jgi:hypothetical protein
MSCQLGQGIDRSFEDLTAFLVAIEREFWVAALKKWTHHEKQTIIEPLLGSPRETLEKPGQLRDNGLVIAG